VLEAMASRRAVVCSDIRLFTDVVESGSQALVFPAGDDEALAAHILRLLGDSAEAERIAEAGMSLVCADFSAENLQERMNEVYDGLLREERP
jgi:glycosyltransferase involved in cell wall biosynthesis